MNSRIAAVALLLLFVCTAGYGQDGRRVICKGESVPEGFVIAGETLAAACNGTGWVIKPRRGAQPGVDQFAASGSNALSEADPNEVIAPGQCDAFQKEIAQTYNFSPGKMNDNQIAAESKQLDVFWDKVRQSRATLVPCLRQALKESHSGSFFAIDGARLS